MVLHLTVCQWGVFWLSAFISNSVLSFLLTIVPACINIFIQAKYAKFCPNKYTFPSLGRNMRKKREILRCVLLGKEKFRKLPSKKNENTFFLKNRGRRGVHWEEKNLLHKPLHKSSSEKSSKPHLRLVQASPTNPKEILMPKSRDGMLPEEAAPVARAAGTQTQLTAPGKAPPPT